MASLEQGLVSYLTGYAGLTAIIGTRVYHKRLPQGVTLPCLTYWRVDTPFHHTHNTGGASGNLESPRFQFDAWGSDPVTCKNITDQLRAALNGKTGSIGGGANAVTIRASLVETEVDEDPDTDAALYRRRSDYIIWQED